MTYNTRVCAKEISDADDSRKEMSHPEEPAERHDGTEVRTESLVEFPSVVWTMQRAKVACGGRMSLPNPRHSATYAPVTIDWGGGPGTLSRFDLTTYGLTNAQASHDSVITRTTTEGEEGMKMRDG